MKQRSYTQTILSSILLIGIVSILLSGLTSGDPTFIVEETQEIVLEVNATDPDGDTISFEYQNPFNQDGAWKTTYDDAGEYIIDVRATDGEHTDTKSITVLVLNKNRAPIVSQTRLKFAETDIIDLSEYIADPDDDILEYTFDAPFDNSGIWHTGYEDSGRYVIDFVVNDGKATVSDRIEIVIEETNQPPSIVSVFSESSRVLIFEDETMHFEVLGEDADGSVVSYLWFLDTQKIGNSPQVEYYFDFESEGEHTLKIEITDGEFVVEREWIMDVQKTNRPPVAQDLNVLVYETETVTLELPKTDIDGDQITYSFESPLNTEGEWKTGFEDAGVHVLEGTMSDGEFVEDFNVSITVLELDRAPIFSVPQLVELSEGQRLEWFVEVYDPDGDDILLEMSNLPQLATFNSKEKTVTWDISHDYITRTNSFIFNMLNSLRIEQHLLKKKDLPISLRACGKELCSKAETTLRIFNTNRAPVFVDLFDQEVVETNSVKLFPTAHDPDGDIVRFRYSEPVHKWNGEWTPGYEDSGRHTISVTATDGFLDVHTEVDINVLNTNRDPTLILKQNKVVVNEGQEFTVLFDAHDADSEDDVTVLVENPPLNSGLDTKSFVWMPSYDTTQNTTDSLWNKLITNSYYLTKKLSSDKEDVWIEFTATDGDATVIQPLHVVVKNVNRIPVINEVIPHYETFETITDVPIQFAIDAYDLDSDDLTYTWSFSGVDIATVKNTDVLTRTFKSAGEKRVKVVVSDARDSVSYEWKIIVKSEEKEPEVHVKYLEQPDFSFRIYKIENWK
jgi:hypothetical protein